MKLRIAAVALLGLLIVGATVFFMSNPDDGPDGGPYEFPTREMPKEELTVLWQKLKDQGKIAWGTADFLSHNDNYVIHEGDLTIGEDRDFVNGKGLIVDGNLVVEGSYDDVGTGHLVVLGDMKATNLLSDGTSVVTGKLTIDELVYCYYNDNISEFAGGVESRAFFVYDKDCSYPSNKTTVEFLAADTYGETDYEMYRHLRPEIAAASVENPAVPDYQTSRDIIWANESVLRAKPASEAFLDAWQRILEDFDGYEELDTDDLAEIAGVDQAFRIIIAARENLEPQLQALLIESGETAVLQAMARNQATTSVHLAQIAERAPAARPMMAGNPNAPVSLFVDLASDPDPDVRAAIAERRDITAALATILVSDVDPKVRIVLTQRGGVHHLDDADLSTLANDADTKVVENLLHSDAPLPAEVYEALAGHPDSDVRYALAKALQRQTLWRNRRTLPLKVRNRIAEGLLSDPREMVFRTAAGALEPDRQLEIGTDWLSKITEGTRHQYWCMGLAEVTTSPALMLKFADAENPDIRESLAENLALSPEAQHRLLDPLDAVTAEDLEIPDELDDIIDALVQNDNVVDEVLLRVARFVEKIGTDARFSTTILHHNDLPAEALTFLWSLDEDEDYHRSVALDILHSPRSPKTLIGPALRLWYDGGEDEDEVILAEYRAIEKLSGDAYWEGLANADDTHLRSIVASNEATPLELILKLAADDAREVSREALDHAKLPVDHPLLLAVFRGEEMPDLSNPNLSDETLLARADRFRKHGQSYHADELFKMLSRRKLRTDHK